MGSITMDGINPPPHAVCIPYPAQGHINPMFKLAKILHHLGFYITFVNTEYNQRRLLKFKGPGFQYGSPKFRFETIPDGLPPPTDDDDIDVTQDLASLCVSTAKNCSAPFCNLISKLNQLDEKDDDVRIPPVTCIVSDGAMFFTLDAARQFGIPNVFFWTTGAAAYLGLTQFKHLVQRGYAPLKDTSDWTNSYLETTVDWIPGMKNIRLKDLPTFIRTTDSNDIFLNFILNAVEETSKASAVVLNTFDALEEDVVNALSAMYPRVYGIGPLHLIHNRQIQDQKLKSMGSNLWKEEPGCIDWLNGKEPNSVVYVNFGSITVMTAQQLTEFAWGLANSNQPFLWIIRPDLLVTGETVGGLPQEFLSQTKGRGMLASWCRQEEVLMHPAIGGFLTHSGWNSTLESICSGVPMICWPFFADQQTNCRYCCVEWGVGMEIDSDVKRDEVEKLLREVVEGGEKGREMKKAAMDWKRMTEEAIAPGGSSSINLDKLVKEVLLPN